LSRKADIGQLLGLLARNADLIEAAYHEGAVLMTDENQSAVRSLHNNRVLYAREDSQFSLTRKMREMLDEHTQRHSTFAIGGNIGDEVDRMEKLLFELEEAASRGKHEDSERYADELSQSLYEIGEYVTQDILQFQHVMSSKFSDVRAIEEKMRQNEHYMERAKRLHLVVEQLNRHELHDRFSSPLVEEPGTVYRKAITRSIDEWSNTLLSISRIFEQFMFSFRRISEQTRRMRAFSQFLKEGGQGKLEEALRKSETCPALSRIAPAKPETRLDIYTDRSRNALASITRDLKPLETRKLTDRQAGKRSRDNETVSIDEDTAPEDRLLSVFLGAVQAAPDGLSAARWAAQTQQLDVASFLEHVLTWSEFLDEDDDHTVRYIEAGSTPARRANIAISDIKVCKAA